MAKTKEEYIGQWKELKEMTKGFSMDDIREKFDGDITNDLTEKDGMGKGMEMIDLNYKDILVTFFGKEVASIGEYIECYDENDNFIEVMKVED